MFQLIVTRFHSPLTFFSPRNENCRNPSADLMMPNTVRESVCAAHRACGLPGLQSMHHLLHRGRRGGRRCAGRCKALPPTGMVTLTAQGHQRFDLRRRAVLDVRFTQVAIVGQQPSGTTQLPRQCLKLLQHRHELALVVRRLSDVLGHDEQTARGYHGLGVVGLDQSRRRAPA